MRMIAKHLLFFLLIMVIFPLTMLAQSAIETPLPTMIATNLPNIPAPTPTATIIPLQDMGKLELGDIVNGTFTGIPFNYQFEGQEGQFIHIFLNNNYTDSLLRLSLPNGVTLATTNFSTNGGGVELIVPRLPVDGIYTITVSTLDVGGAYSLRLNQVVVESAEYGQTIEGQLPPGSPVIAYIFSGEAGDSVYYHFFSDQWVSLGNVYSESDTIQSLYAQDSRNNPNGWLSAYILPSTGNYFLILRSADGVETGDYRLRIDKADFIPIAYGDQAQGNITFESPFLNYQFQGEMGDIIDVRVEGEADFDTTLALIAPDKTPLYWDDDAANQFDPEMGPFLISNQGTYTILIAPFDDRDTGRIRLSLSRATPLSLDEGPQDVRLTPKHPQASFNFTGVAGEHIRLMISVVPVSQSSPRIVVSQDGQSLASPSAQGISTFTVDFTVPKDGVVAIQVGDANYIYTTVSLSLERLTE